MPTWNSRGLRGSTFEDLINHTHERYAQQHLALIQKIPTPITPIEIDQESRHITLAYFDQKSTVDYIGAVQGVPVAFDAKECKSDTFALQNVHPHQIDFMNDYEAQDGVTFLLIYFTQREIFYYLRHEELMGYWNRMLGGGRKSFTFDELDEDFFFTSPNGLWVPYLPLLQKDLEARDD